MASSRKREEKPKAEPKERKAPKEEESLKNIVAEIANLIGPMCTRSVRERLEYLRDKLRER